MNKNFNTIKKLKLSLFLTCLFLCFVACKSSNAPPWAIGSWKGTLGLTNLTITKTEVSLDTVGIKKSYSNKAENCSFSSTTDTFTVKIKEGSTEFSVEIKKKDPKTIYVNWPLIGEVELKKVE